jgi:hypothetical protein
MQTSRPVLENPSLTKAYRYVSCLKNNSDLMQDLFQLLLSGNLCIAVFKRSCVHTSASHAGDLARHQLKKHRDRHSRRPSVMVNYYIRRDAISSGKEEVLSTDRKAKNSLLAVACMGQCNEISLTVRDENLSPMVGMRTLLILALMNRKPSESVVSRILSTIPFSVLRFAML